MFRFCFLFLIAVSLLPAQSSNSVDLQGTVADAAGGMIPGAGLTVTNTETLVARTGVTNSLGRYRFPALPAGSHDWQLEPVPLPIGDAGISEVRSTHQGLFVGGNKGLYIQQGQVHRLLTVADGLKDNWVQSVVIGPDGAIWIACFAPVGITRIEINRGDCARFPSRSPCQPSRTISRRPLGA